MYTYKESVTKLEKLITQYIAAGIFYRFDVQVQQHWFSLADFLSDAIVLLLVDDSCPFGD